MKINLIQHFDGGRGAIVCDNQACNKGIIAAGWFPHVKFFYRNNYKILIRKTKKGYAGYCSVLCLLQCFYGKRLINKIIRDNMKQGVK